LEWMNNMDNETKNKISNLERQVAELTSTLETFKRDYSKHEHDNVDGTKRLTKDIEIDKNNFFSVGYGGQGSAPVQNIGTATEQLQYSIGLSRDNRRGFVNKLDTLQFNFIHKPNNTLKQSFINAFRGIVVSSLPDQTVATTAGGNTITISGFNFTTNELAGEVINISNSSGTFIESRVIASNTSTVITITGTWGASTSNANFGIFSPVFLGSAETIWQRFYTQEGTDGGIRFGMGVTAGALNQNGLLYMDATGDLYWRNKSGTSTKLN